MVFETTNTFGKKGRFDFGKVFIAVFIMLNVFVLMVFSIFLYDVGHNTSSIYADLSLYSKKKEQLLFDLTQLSKVNNVTFTNLASLKSDFIVLNDTISQMNDAKASTQQSLSSYQNQLDASLQQNTQLLDQKMSLQQQIDQQNAMKLQQQMRAKRRTRSS